MKSRNLKALLVLLVVVLFGVAGRVSAQGVSQPVICQDVNYGAGSFVFHIPAEWNNPDIASWTALGAGLSYLTADNDPTAFRIDALQEVEIYNGEGWPDWYQYIKVGNVLVMSGDYSVILVGDASTPVCDDNGHPVVPATAPEQTSELSCTNPVSNGATGKVYFCQTDPNAVVPIPPAP